VASPHTGGAHVKVPLVLGGGVGVGVGVGVLVGVGVGVLVGVGVGVLVGVGAPAKTATRCSTDDVRFNASTTFSITCFVPTSRKAKLIEEPTPSVELSTESLQVYLQGRALQVDERPSKVTGCPVAGEAGDHVKAAVGP
jgi:hypothetical protein